MSVLVCPGYQASPDGIVRTFLRVGTLPAEARAILQAAVEPTAAHTLHTAFGAPAIQSLIRQGWLAPLDELAARPVHGPPRSAVIAIPSRGRPQHLQRLLHDLRQRSTGLPVLVALDGTPDEVARSLEVCARADVPHLRVSTPSTRARTAEWLAQGIGASPSLFKVVLAGTPAPEGVNRTGAARNALLLEAGRQAIVWLDDDLRLRGVRRDGDPCWRDRTPTFLSDPDASPPAEGLDPLEVLGPLGYGPTDLLDLSFAWPTMGPWSIRALTSPHPAQVVLSSGGLYGDEGTPHNAHRLFLMEGLAARLLDDPDAWSRWRTTRTALRLPAGPTVTPTPQWLTAWAGTDARGTLPPFLPAGRAADTLFALHLKAIRPQALLAAVPASMCHEPDPRPVQPDEVVYSPLQHLLTHWVAHITASMDHDPAPQAKTRLRRIGYQLLGMVEGDPSCLAARWLDFQLTEDARRYQRLIQLRGSGPDVPAWHKDVDAALQLLAQAQRAPRHRTPADLAGRDPRDPETWVTAGRILAALGHLILHWDDARDAWSSFPSPFEPV